jgi:hypothetical protein
MLCLELFKPTKLSQMFFEAIREKNLDNKDQLGQPAKFVKNTASGNTSLYILYKIKKNTITGDVGVERHV